MNNLPIKKLAFILPFIIIIVVTFGFILLFIIGRIDLGIRSLKLLIPCILSALLLLMIYKKNISISVYDILQIRINKLNILLLFILTYICSIYILISISYNIIYYVLIILLYLIIFIQIISKNSNTFIILSEIMITMVNIIYGVTLKNPLYFGETDLPTHIFLSEITYLSGHVIPVSLTSYYSYFPLYHILIAEGSYLLSIDVKTTLFIMACPIFVCIILFIYYIFYNTIKNKQISLLTCLIFSASSTVLLYGKYMVTRTLAFVGFIILLYLLYKVTEKIKFKITYSILILLSCLFVILVHQVSITQILSIMFLLLACEWIINSKKYLTSNYILIIICIFCAYWLFCAFIFFNNLMDSYIQPEYFVNPVIESTMQSGNLIQNPYLFLSISPYIFLFFALLGIGYLLWKNNNSYTSVFALFALITLILYVPSPLQMFWQLESLFRIDRYMLLISPFMAFVMAYGIYILYYYLSTIKYIKQISMLIIAVCLLAFFLTSSDYIPILMNTPHDYFSTEEINGFNFVDNYVPYGSILYSDYYTDRYFIQTKFDLTDELNLPYYYSNTIYDVNNISEYNGYLIIRQKELTNTGIYFSSPSDLYAPTYENIKNLNSNLYQFNKLSSNGGIDLFYNGHF